MLARLAIRSLRASSATSTTSLTRGFSVGHKNYDNREKAEEDRFIRTEEEKRKLAAKEKEAASNSLKRILGDLATPETIEKLLAWKDKKH